jgi:hypothetical protein
VITDLAGNEPIDVVQFGNVAAGYSSPGVPLRLAYLSESGRPARMTDPAYVRALLGVLRGLPAEFRPAAAQTVTLAGQAVFCIAYDAPSPLGLLQGSK